MMQNGTAIRPPTAANAPLKPRMRVPTKIATLTWLAPGSSRHRVTALRNSVSVSQPRRRTTTSCDQAERPPPKLESEMRLNVQARSHRLGGATSCGLSPCAVANGSFMSEFGIERMIGLYRQLDVHRVRRVIAG